MMVRMSEQMGAGRDGAAVAVWHDSTRKLALLFAPMVGLLVVTAHAFIVLLFTERYAEAVPVFVVSSLGLLLPVIAVDAVLRVRAETRTLFGLNLVRLAVTIALIIPLVAAFGLVGAALATVLAAAATKALGLVRIGAVDADAALAAPAVARARPHRRGGGGRGGGRGAGTDGARDAVRVARRGERRVRRRLSRCALGVSAPSRRASGRR